MKKSLKRTVKKVAAVSLAAAMAFSVSPMVKADAKVKAPTLTPKTVVIVKGNSKTLKVKKGTYKIKSIKWTSTKTKVATVKKKTKLTAKVTAKDYGVATIKAVVTTKKSAKKTKKYTLKRKVEVIEEGEPDEPDMPTDTWFTVDPKVEPDGVVDKFTIINEGLVGARYTPFIKLGAYIGSDGVNKWRVLAKKTLTTATPTSSYVLVEISENAAAETHLDKVVETGIEALPEVGNDGGWSEATDPTIDSEVLARIDGTFNPAGLVGGTYYDVIGMIGSQVVAGVRYKVIGEKHLAGVQNPPKTYFILDVVVGADGTITPDWEGMINIGMEDKAPSDRVAFTPKGYEGVTIKEVGLDKVNGVTWNAYAIFANASDKDVDFDTSKFEFELPDGKKYTLIPGTWELRKNHTYIQWATTALKDDFKAALNVGDKVKVYYDGEEFGWITASQWPEV